MNLLGLILVGFASYYSEGTMSIVLENRQSGNAWVELPMVLPFHVGMIAVRDCEHLGNVWWLRPTERSDFEPFLIVDCARPPGTDGAYEWMSKNGIMVELDYETAEKWDGIGKRIKIERLVRVEP